MNRAPVLVALLCSTAAVAANYAVGQVMVVEDTTGAQHDVDNLGPLNPFGTALCQYAAKGLYSQFADDYDGVVMFTTHPMDTQEMGLHNTMLGNIVRQTTQGISDTAFASFGNPVTQYGSAAKLSQCVFMGSLGQLPVNPDDQVTTLFGGFIPLGMGVTGAELMGHEYGHHWLLWAAYDKNDGKGKRYLMRGDTGDPADPQIQPNGHWNHYADARSVMYGSFITPQGGTSYELKGGVRKYNEFDQYFMGLRAAADVSPMLIVDDGSGRGAAVQPLWRNATQTVAGTGFTVDVQDVIRAIGVRNPSSLTSQKCFRVAFALVTQQGHGATAAEIAKADAYRKRFATWFNFATDGRGYMDTTLTGPPGCQATPPVDGGVVVAPDAGTVVADAGRVGVDAGVADAGAEVDAGVTQPVADAGVAVADAGKPPPGKWETLVPLEGTTKLKSGCGCNAGAPFGMLGLLVVALRAAVRRRR